MRPLALMLVLGVALAPEAQAQTRSMVCRFLPGNAFFSTGSPEGDQNEQPANRYCPVRITMTGGQVRGEELCPGETVPKAFRGTVVANQAYPGNVIVLWADDLIASASLWAISFERKEVGVSYAFAAQYTEAGAQWLKCSD